MKAVVKKKKGRGNIGYIDVPKPKILDDEVLIKVKAAGICGTDIHIMNDQFPYWPPVILGHEFSGVIEKVGKKIKYFKEGDRVTSEPHQRVCGLCRFCRLGLIHLCSDKRSPGWGIDGAMTSYIKLPENLLHKLPDNISFIEGAVLEPLSTVTHAVIERGVICPEDFVVVIGPGPIGLMAAQVAKAAGAKRVAIVGEERHKDFKLKVASELNIDFVINSDEMNTHQFILSKTNDLGADMVIECSGSEGGLNQSIEVLAKRGRLVAMGMSGRENLNITWNKAIFRELDIYTSLSSTYTSWRYAISMVEDRKINLSKIISHKLPLSEYRKAFNLIISKKALKIVLIPNEEFGGIDV